MSGQHDRPWMTALEMQFTTLGIARKLAVHGTPESVTTPYVFKYLSSSTPFSWLPDVTMAVWMASKSIPLSARFNRELFPDGLRRCWWWLEWPLPISLKRRSGFEELETFAEQVNLDGISALLLAIDEAGTLVVCDGRQTTHGPLMCGLLKISVEASLEEILQGQAVDARTGALMKDPESRTIDLIRFIMAASVWLKQRVVVVSNGHIERHRRKQLEREHNTVVSDVKVIELRRAESSERMPNPNDEPVEWSCRWIVSGHWRNQVYAQGEHKLIYILPFVKGPADKPLRVPTHTVYQVDR